MKKITLITSLMLLAYNLSFAGVAGSKHDMYFLGKGTDPNVCSYCHIPHNAAGEKIWSKWANEARLTSGPSTAMGNMCYTCHDGTVTWRGQIAFGSPSQQHKIPAGQDCDMCHSVHDNTNFRFMKVAQIVEFTYCPSCHNAAVNAGGLGDHVSAPGNHQSCNVCHSGDDLENLGDSLDNATCHLCHVRAHGGASETIGNITNPILSNYNKDSQLCGGCHSDNVQSASGGAKHPANTSGGAYGKIICRNCHDPHQPGVVDRPYLLTETNIDSQMCINCHDGSNGPDVGHSHPYQVGLGSIVPTDPSAQTGTPLGNQINDDYWNSFGMPVPPDMSPDYPLNSASVICETCHSVHRKADASGTKLLRITNTNSALCFNCHTDK